MKEIRRIYMVYKNFANPLRLEYSPVGRPRIGDLYPGKSRFSGHLLQIENDLFLAG
jgi:hypothetical protein